MDGSQVLAHSATQDGAEAKTVVVASRRWRESRGLAAWLHRAGTRGRTIDRRRDDGEEVEEAEIPTGQPPTSLATEATTNLHLRPQRGQTFTSNLMLHYWKDVPALIEDHWNTGPQGQTYIHIYATPNKISFLKWTSCWHILCEDIEHMYSYKNNEKTFWTSK